MRKEIKANLAKVHAAFCSGFRDVKRIVRIALALLNLKFNPVFSILLQKLRQLKAAVVTAGGSVLWLANLISRKRRMITVTVLLGVFIFNLFALNTIGAQLLSQTRLGSTGRITSVGVSTYSDGAGANPITNVNWGTLYAGGTVSKTIYVKNEGSAYMTLSLDTASWYPSTAQNYITLTWSYSGQALEPYQITPVTLTLAVSPYISGVGSFSFEIIITGTN